MNENYIANVKEKNRNKPIKHVKAKPASIPCSNHPTKPVNASLLQ